MVNHEKCIALTPHHWRVYTDGSGINGHVGASATCPQNQIQKQAYLGPDKEFTVPIAELVGLALALEIAKEATDRQMDIFVDHPPKTSASFGAGHSEEDNQDPRGNAHFSLDSRTQWNSGE